MGPLEVFFIILRYLYSLVSERLRDCNFVHRHNFTSGNYTKFLVFVFDTEIGRLCAFNGKTVTQEGRTLLKNVRDLDWV